MLFRSVIYLLNTFSKAYDSIVHVVASGNDGIDLDDRNSTTIFPADLSSGKTTIDPDFITVGALAPSNKSGFWKFDEIANYSNYGADTVDVFAPGEVLSVIVDVEPGVEMYGFMQGTSFAVPYVSSLVELMQNVNPNLTPKDIKRIIIDTSVPLPALAGKGRGGVVQFYDALIEAISTSPFYV